MFFGPPVLRAGRARVEGPCEGRVPADRRLSRRLTTGWRTASAVHLAAPIHSPSPSACRCFSARLFCGPGKRELKGRHNPPPPRPQITVAIALPLHSLLARVDPCNSVVDLLLSNPRTSALATGSWLLPSSHLENLVTFAMSRPTFSSNFLHTSTYPEQWTCGGLYVFVCPYHLHLPPHLAQRSPLPCNRRSAVAPAAATTSTLRRACTTWPGPAAAPSSSAFVSP